MCWFFLLKSHLAFSLSHSLCLSHAHSLFRFLFLPLRVADCVSVCIVALSLSYIARQFGFCFSGPGATLYPPISRLLLLPLLFSFFSFFCSFPVRVSCFFFVGGAFTACDKFFFAFSSVLFFFSRHSQRIYIYKAAEMWEFSLRLYYFILFFLFCLCVCVRESLSLSVYFSIKLIARNTLSDPHNSLKKNIIHNHGEE